MGKPAVVGPVTFGIFRPIFEYGFCDRPGVGTRDAENGHRRLLASGNGRNDRVKKAFAVSFDQILASAPSDNPTDSPNNRNNDLKLSLHSNSKQQFSRGYVDSMHDTSHQFNLMRIASETLNVQIKVYMTFMGKLSSRKIGRKGVDKVYLFMNAKEQFTLLLKARCARREADDFFQQVISAHSFWSGYKLRHLHHDRNAV